MSGLQSSRWMLVSWLLTLTLPRRWIQRRHQLGDALGFRIRAASLGSRPHSLPTGLRLVCMKWLLCRPCAPCCGWHITVLQGHLCVQFLIQVALIMASCPSIC